ncbi:MAG: mechanosensitive ion channel [Pirellulales bacterium]|nr:mechanosensitive ion channel [Pirellulales bacterium]
MIRSNLLLRIVTAACLGPFSAPGAFSASAADQPLVEKSPAEEVTVEIVQDRLRQLDGMQGIDEATKDKTRELLQQAQQELDLAKTWAAAAERFEQMVTTAPDELARTKTDLEALPRKSPSPIALPEASLAQLVQLVSEREGELAARKAALTELEAEPKRRAARRVDIPKLVSVARERLAETDKQLQAAMATPEPAEIAVAKRLVMTARRQATEQELLSYEKELRAYEVRAELLPLRRDLAAGQIGLAERELMKWRETLNRRRQHDAETQLRRAQQEVEQAHPAIVDVTRRNAEMAERRKRLAQLIVQATGQLDNASQKLAALKDQFTRTQDKVDAVGLTNAIGLLLRKQREAMPDIRSQRRNIKRRQPEIRESHLELLQLEDRRCELANLEAQIQREWLAAGAAGHQADRDELEGLIRSALETEKEGLDALIADLNTYFDKLVDLDSAEQQLTEQTEQYDRYIDERVLWIRSTSVFGLSAVDNVAKAAVWLLAPDSWLGLLSGLALGARSDPLPVVLAVLVFAPWVFSQRRLRKKIGEIGETAQRANCCSLLPTLEAVLLSALIASLVPAVFWYLSWRLNAAGDASEFSKAVATGLAYAAGIYLILGFLQQMCRADGLSDAHFGWPTSSLKPVRHYVQAAKLLIPPLVFVATTLDSQGSERWSDSLGRLSFMAAMLVCSVLVQRALRKSGGIYQALLAARLSNWTDRLRLLWYPVVVLMPSALAALAAVGYYYTALQLAQRMLACTFILLGLMLLRSLLLRWVLVKRRGLAIEQARRLRAAGQADAKPAGESAVASFVPAPNEPNLDLAAINVQTRQFVEYSLALTGFVGIWLVWVDVLPALRILDRIPLWQSLDQAEPTSLADLGLAILIMMTTLIAAKNLAGLLEMAVLRRLPLDAGFRYTVVAVARYIALVIGILVACHTIGLSWGKVQWLIAAVSVGLGFGLQEIFANFVSGLIILFERPVRVGDVVTVDDITGVVSRIRMRATTITNWDRKEFIVPNKEFITGRLLNWTLSDHVNRVVVNVGIAYGSDTSLAAETLVTVAREHPLVLDDPTPVVTFEEFGASSLNFVLRCYLPNMENRLQIIHELHMSIDRDFRRAGIEIAFPQQDVHVRSVHADPSVFGWASGSLPKTPGLARPDGEDEGEDEEQGRHVA